jgi:hypothetical protein
MKSNRNSMKIDLDPSSPRFIALCLLAGVVIVMFVLR